MNKPVKQIIIEHLKVNGFDGLCPPDMSCGCSIEDLMICEEYCGDCIPAYLLENGNLATKKPK